MNVGKRTNQLGVSEVVCAPCFSEEVDFFSHSFKPTSKASHTDCPRCTPPSSPSSAIKISSRPSLVSPEGNLRAGMRMSTTAHSRYNAPAFKTSRVDPSLEGCATFLKGVGRKSTCSTDCAADIGDLVNNRSSGCKIIYLTRTSIRRKTRRIAKSHRINPRIDRLCNFCAFSRGAIVSARLIPGQTDTATIFDFWTFSLTTGIVFSSVLGTCPLDGSASRTRWRCRVKTAI